MKVARNGIAPEYSVPRWIAPFQVFRVLTPPLYRWGVRTARRVDAADAGPSGGELGPDDHPRAGSSTGEVEPDVPWVVIVWNDPINLMTYVTWVFQKLFGYPRAKAERLMWDVHTKGKAVVAHGPKERCEAHVAALHGYGLWATMQKDR